MDLPTSPPQTDADTSSQFWRQLEEKLRPLEDHYLHWEHLQAKPIPIQNVSHKQWWQLLKAKRRARQQPLPFADQRGKPFYWVFDDRLMKKLSQLESQLTLQFPAKVRFVAQANALIAEAISSAQLNGIAIPTTIAQDLLCSGCPATTPAEQAVLDYYYGLCDIARQPKLTINALQRLQRQLAEQAIIAPLTTAQREKLVLLVEFANQNTDHFSGFMSPILKAIILHFMLSQESLFEEVSSSIARMVFYQQMLSAGYFSMQSISISYYLLQTLAAYQRVFLFTYTDDNDITYFIMQQLDTLLIAVDNYIKMSANISVPVVETDKTLNLRQQLIVHEMQQYPQRQFRIAAIKHRFNITYETARTDLLGLVKHHLAKQSKVGKAFVYCAK